ncbi:MAG TPA: hypothetical protein VFC35_00175, partial [Gemmatimonadaceae bacterium]|nr:hypothetical protein [Gemmatimonadaceae bacterium]
TYRMAVASGADKMKEIFPAAVDLGGGEFDIPITNLTELNAAIAKAIAAGVMLASFVPSRSVLEQQFREAVGETNA